MMRKEALEKLKQTPVFDLLVIGGGATGCGVALDAASRGLKVALVEKNDFAEGTSSRSTKLVHGGVRYLELAVKQLDRVQFHLVRSGLKERGLLLKNAPHLSNRLPLVTPLYNWLEVPYVFAGLKLYDLLAGRLGIGHSRLLSRRKALRRFPMLRVEGLKAGVLYYDGQFLDARTALTLALTAREHGAVVANHVEASALIKKSGRLTGAVIKDRISGETWQLGARSVINATGPFADRVRWMDEPAAEPILKVSSGIHIVLDGHFAPPDTGLLIPATEDGRVLFVLPWEGHALVGTTDEPAEVTEHPRPHEEEIDYLLRHLGRYFDLQVTRRDIKAAWSGLRPLVYDPHAVDTSRLARDHVLDLSRSGLLTVAGGKWTTYRQMAEDAVDRAVEIFNLNPQRGCQTEKVMLVGGDDYDPDGSVRLSGEYGLPADVARHLNHAYGDRAYLVARMARETGAARLVQGHPYLEAEAIYGARNEFAERAMDVLARRISLALLDRDAAWRAMPRVLEGMARELGWDEARIRNERLLAEGLLKEAL